MTKALISLGDIFSSINGLALSLRERAGISSFCIDSRKAGNNKLFVPLLGENTDGHLYIDKAVEGGCLAFLCSQKHYAMNAAAVNELASRCSGGIIVDDPLRAMQKIAKEYVAGFKNLKKIGVTGSNGKTTSRLMTAAVLSSCGATVQTEGNLNSDIGLPISVMQIGREHEYAVFEMGINYPGEMDILADVFGPEFGLFTNIGSAHIGILKSKDNIALEKRKMLKRSGSNGAAFVFEGENYKDFLCEGVKKIEFGPEAQKVRGYKDLGLSGSEFVWQNRKVKLGLAGRHNYLNALGSLRVGEFFGADRAEAADALEQVRPMFGRTEILSGDVTIIQDCYNANPESTEKSLEMLGPLRVEGSKIAVLGEMLELGERSAELHRQTAEKAMAMNLDWLFFFGEEYLTAFNNCPPEVKGCRFYLDIDKLVEGLESVLKPGDLLLLKGSRGLSLERVAEKLKKESLSC